MRHLTRTALIGMLLGAWIITAPQATQGADRDARAPRDPVQFSPPTFVDPPKVLLGDAGSPRCPDPRQPCLQNVDDLLFGRTHILRSDDFVFGFQGGRGIFSTQDSTIPSQGAHLQLFDYYVEALLNNDAARYTQPAVVGARLFNTASDGAVTLVHDRNLRLLHWQLDSFASTVASGTVELPVSLPDPASFLSVVAGDFTGDGFDEIVVFLTAVGSNGAAIVGTAVDPQDPSKGLRFGPVELFFGPSPGSPHAPGPSHLEPLKITKATVLGQPRVFVVGPTNYLADQCPTGHSGLSFERNTINPQSLGLSTPGPVKTHATSTRRSYHRSSWQARSARLAGRAEAGRSAAPPRCAATKSRTGLTTKLMLDDGGHPAQVLEWTPLWPCEQNCLSTPSLSVMTLGWDMPTRARLQRPPPAPREMPESLDADRGVLVT